MPDPETLDYRAFMEEALRGVIRDSLRQVALHGLPGTHHFFIAFRTAEEGVAMPDSLRRSHPEEMTIVLQHQFRDLVVEDGAFAVTLNFNAVPMRLTVPFGAITSFVDPSAEFGLRFDGGGPPPGGDEAGDGDGSARPPRGEVVPFSRPAEGESGS